MGIKFYMCGSGNVYHLGCLKDAWGVWGVSDVFDNILCEFKKLKISKGGGGGRGPDPSSRYTQVVVWRFSVERVFKLQVNSTWMQLLVKVYILFQMVMLLVLISTYTQSYILFFRDGSICW